jgi:hypothetical protein
VAEGVFDTKVPAPQVPHVAHATVLRSVLKVPSAQVVHCRSAVVEGAFDTEVPAGQSLHDAQADALEPALKVPSAQFVHTVSLLLVAACPT